MQRLAIFLLPIPLCLAACAGSRPVSLASPSAATPPVVASVPAAPSVPRAPAAASGSEPPPAEVPPERPAAPQPGPPPVVAAVRHAAKPAAEQRPPSPRNTSAAARAPASKPATEALAGNPAAAPARQAAAPARTLDLSTLEQRLKETRAIGLFTKLSLKNQVDDLLAQFRAVYNGRANTPMADLHQKYDLLLLKVLSLLQDSDPGLASDIASSRQAIWQILADPKKFSAI